jgi:hypothetical protein
MGRLSMSGIATLALISCFSFLGGCRNLTAPEAPAGALTPLTGKEGVISSLVRAYITADITLYDALLHEDYTFHLQASDVASGQPEFWTREHDIQVTRNMFLAAKGRYLKDPAKNLDKLTLELGPGEWSPVDCLGDRPCVDCWVTTRAYRVTIMFSGGRGGYVANDLAEIVIVPVKERGQKTYKIWRLTDIQRADKDR